MCDMHIDSENQVQQKYKITQQKYKVQIFAIYILFVEKLLQSATDVCDCIVPCKTSRYNPNLSYTHLSKMNIERLVLLDDNEKEQVKQEFEKASETLHRVKDDLVQDDIRRMTRIIETSRNLENILVDSSLVYTNFTTFSSEYQVIDVLGYASNYMEEDFQYYGDKIEGSTKMLKDHGAYYDVAYLGKILEYYTPLENGSYNYFDTFTSCLAIGLDSAGDMRHVENVIEATTVQMENETDIDNTDDDNNITVTTAAPWEQLNRAPDVPTFQYYRPVFNSIECDNSVLHSMQYRFFYSNDILELLVDAVTRYREWYMSLTAFFPQDNLEQQVDHQKCIDTLDWYQNDGFGLFTEYYQHINNITAKINVIMDRYVHGHEDRSGLEDEIQSLYEVVSGLTNFLFSDSAAPLWKLTTNYILYEEGSDEPVTFRPDGLEDPDPLICLWLFDDIISLAEVGTKAHLYLLYHTSNHENLIEAFAAFSTLLKTVSNYYQRIIKPGIEHFDEYLREDLEKLDLVRLITQPKSIKSTDELADKINSLDDSLDDLIERTNDEAEKTEELLMMPLNLTVPLLSYQTINETVFGREMYKYRTELYTGFDNEAMQDHFQSTFLGTGEKHFQRILNVIGDLQGNVTSTMDSLVDQLADEREYLQTYKRDTRMDADFYMLVICIVIIIQLNFVIIYT